MSVVLRTFFGLVLMCPVAASAQSLIANRAIPSKSIVSAMDVSISQQEIPGAFHRVEDAVGLEARVTIYPGRPVRMGDLGPPAVIERNDVVVLRYAAGGLSIEADGRALQRAGVGDYLRVMNLSSRTTITGRVSANGIVEVGR